MMKFLDPYHTSSIFKPSQKKSSWWAAVEKGPPDPILGLKELFTKDTNPKKINLGVGAYRDDKGKPYVLPSVKKAEEIVFKKCLNKEYPPISGIPEFCPLAAKLAFGECSEIIQNGLNATVQTLSGTGALSLAANFLKRFFPGPKVIYMPGPTWANHKTIFKMAGLETKTYRYYDNKKLWLCFDWILEDICRMPEKSIILLHVCAHNPTGIDLSSDEWKEISSLIKKKNIFPFFDFAYQGFATGVIENDNYPLRTFAADCHNLLVTQSFAKNMGLYGERIGALSITTNSKTEVDIVLSQLKILIRGTYSVPPIHGARLVIEVLSDTKLKDQWICELKEMSSRIANMRQKLVENLKQVGSTRDWEHITKQIGMFSYTGLNQEQVEELIKKHSIYLTKDGRISMAAVSSNNVGYLAESIQNVTK